MRKVTREELNNAAPGTLFCEHSFWTLNIIMCKTDESQNNCNASIGAVQDFYLKNRTKIKDGDIIMLDDEDIVNFINTLQEMLCVSRDKKGLDIYTGL